MGGEGFYLILGGAFSERRFPIFPINFKGRGFFSGFFRKYKTWREDSFYAAFSPRVVQILVEAFFNISIFIFFRGKRIYLFIYIFLEGEFCPPIFPFFVKM